MRRLAPVGAAVALVLATGLLASPADAAARTVRDQRGDALSAVDITSLRVRNAEHRVRVTIRVPRLERRRVGGVTVFLGRKVAGRPEYAASKVRRAGGWKTTWQQLDASRLRCSGMRFRIRPRSVVLSVPQRCLGDNRAAVRVQVAVFTRAYLHGNVPEEVLIDPKPGPRLPIDGVPKARGARMTPWAAYR
ncbi:hypothetical protein KV102_16605 [Mumia sp. zg.B53]|uniref:hypothetical protein n=1 Tax=unclassified Mumia TaxID=2621872 RepID=UPI001C6EF545|nr:MULTISPECIES: hypothetical protein [unclassified Mumia]MBW9205495.1 hypothetical protein [Mumia sp. zg.B17]MBW9216462.1 hypothetical protein [Mumia sp. zg.B53]MDD9349552.1 hypothetical protein [Mumia sp.]